MRDLKYLENSVSEYAAVREELLRFGRSVRENGISGRESFAEDRLLWIYDLFVQLSMLETASVKDGITNEDIGFIREFAGVTGHGNLLDVINGTFLNEYRNKCGDSAREFSWEDIAEADVGAVRRMIVALRRNFAPLSVEFSELYATIAAANGLKDIKKTESFTMSVLVAFASVDGEITLEEEDKIGDCSIVKLLNTTAFKIAGFSA